MTDKDKHLCPFSKAIIGKWCRCPHANLSDRCAGKMHCLQPKQQLPICQQLVQQLENNTRFILGIIDNNIPLTHQQYMKIKCGGIQGMHRVLQPDQEQLPTVTDITEAIQQRYGELSDFPYNEIVRDIAGFSHRISAKKKNRQDKTH